MSLKPKKRKQRSSWGSKTKRDTLKTKGWKQTDDWTWKKGDFEISITLDDSGYYNVDVWKRGSLNYVNIEVTKSKRLAFKIAMREMLDDKVHEYFRGETH